MAEQLPELEVLAGGRTWRVPYSFDLDERLAPAFVFYLPAGMPEADSDAALAMFADWIGSAMPGATWSVLPADTALGDAGGG